MAFDSLVFYVKVYILRWATRILAYLDRKRYPALSITPSSNRSILVTLTSPGNFDIFFYHPPGYETAKDAQYPIVVVLHGGGWCVGHARDDERFIATLTARGAVVAAVNYRLSPEHPYPAPLEDCLNALLYIWENAATMRLDKHRTYITGFSVGGTMAFASQFMLWKALQDGHPRIDRVALGTVKGITAFYPPMDLTRSRAERAASNPSFAALEKKPISSSKLIGSTLDRAYFWNVQKIPDKSHSYISPGLAPAEMIKIALPERIHFKLAGLDPLLEEGKTAAARIKALGKQVDWEVTEDVPHYWDHLAKTEEMKNLRQAIHEKAADEIQEVLEMKDSI
ncbi:hypothetical protein ASPWEDRAFT_119330 [Aspergillus wentii DTO 134E9]|uniref:Alpha/beta hydrolase fold-3 domain-containing protein n=1 Tax=Aspergillus wentii DTO 134E9 TaxID=1073089 RepID=A0A1L9R7B0_ASPWE|nr:uncharacterized protein ASPWEDRAFT_119330 [Aspergillus wentii DTO 134E9]KAI9927427.1 hypothetical protein MW887_003040 [Aspergillus wentii]OJJ30799.1 hypothetical protein ASPWEDRAFT_119330 [Aspergillus wentii DTO 134E9]